MNNIVDAILANADSVCPKDARRTSASFIERAVLTSISPDGSLMAKFGDGQVAACFVLCTGPFTEGLKVGDAVLVWRPVDQQWPVVLGRVTTYPSGRSKSRLTIEATESLTLKCGESQVDLRADGKVMVKGDDVLIRAKGTQRIRAGTVAIN